MAALPPWYPDPAETKPAPEPLLLVQAFLNTRAIEEQSDFLAEPEVAREWLGAAGLRPAGVALTARDLEQARAVRDGLLGLVAGEVPAALSALALSPLRALAATHRPRLSIDDHGRVTVENARREDLADGLFELLLIVRGAQEDGSWARLKACGNEECRWVFYDRSRNRQGSWCDMTVCGNRLKNRALRARKR